MHIPEYDQCTPTTKHAIRATLDAAFLEHMLSLRSVMLAIADICVLSNDPDEHLQSRNVAAYDALREFANDPRIRE